MSYRTTRAFERRPSTPPDFIDVLHIFGNAFGRQMDGKIVQALAVVTRLFGGIARLNF